MITKLSIAVWSVLGTPFIFIPQALLHGKGALVPGCELVATNKCEMHRNLLLGRKRNPKNLVVSKSQSGTSHWEHSLCSLIFHINANSDFSPFFGIFDIFKAHLVQQEAVTDPRHVSFT